MTPLEQIGNLDFWFEVLDGYEGPEEFRADFLAMQWTTFGDEAATDGQIADAALVIREWNTARIVSHLAATDRALEKMGAGL